MSIEKILVDLSPLIDYYDSYIDNKIGILSSVAIKEELIVTEVLLLMGMEMHPSNNSLRLILSENVVTDVKDEILDKFNNLVYGLLRTIDPLINFEYGSITARPIGCYMLELTLHKAMSPHQIAQLINTSELST